MSGAKLQTAGQVRNVLPFLTQKALSGSMAILTAPNTESPLVDTVDIPFDYGPDKAGRVFPVFSGFSVLLSAATYAAAGQAVGDIYYRDGGGYFIHLLSVDCMIAKAVAFNLPDKVFIPFTPLFGNKVANIGSIVWRDLASIASTTSEVLLNYRINVGYYGDYAEFDMTKLHDELHDQNRHILGIAEMNSQKA